MAKEEFYRYPDGDYGDGAFLEEYRGAWSLVSAKEGKNGETYKRWCFPQGQDRKPMAKGIPWKVKLGDNKEDAVNCLKFFLQCMTGRGVPAGDAQTAAVPDDQIPF